MDHVHLHRGQSPLLISVPHAGTDLPDEVAARLRPSALALPDTDWYVDELYAFARALGVGMLRARWSRYVIDLNRPADDGALYAQRTTGLVPLETFAGEPLYRDDPPDDVETRQRLERYWRPYHQVLGEEMERLRSRHGHAVLLDAHSIRSRVPALFEGVLPHFSLGTNDGRSAAPDLVSGAFTTLSSDARFDTVRDARFRGGHITRHQGQPERGCHALQLEMAQRAYMRETPPVRDPERQATVTPILERFVTGLRDWRPV